LLCDKPIIILWNANSELLAEEGDFIKQSTELQKWGSHGRSKVWHVKNMLVNRIYFVDPILWSNCNFLCFLCFVCLYLYLLDPHGCIMQIKNNNNNIIKMLYYNHRTIKDHYSEWYRCCHRSTNKEESWFCWKTFLWVE
jgi:hypothetical protein